MEARRVASLNGAERLIAVIDKIKTKPPTETPMAIEMIIIDEVQPTPRKPKTPRQAVLKIEMLLHFSVGMEPFAPEKTRTSEAYTQFVRELLRDGLIERPTDAEREACPGWAYRTTPKGDVLVHAICTVPMPVEKTRWVIPS